MTLSAGQSEETVRIALDVSNLSFAVQGRNIVSGISFRMRAGEIRAVIGPNGAGKSTLVRCVAGVLAKSGGRVELAGHEQGRLPRRMLAREICYLPQFQDILPAFSVRDFVAMGRYAHAGFWSGLGPDDWRRVDEALALANVAALGDRLLPTLSGGERQLVAIAAGLAQGASLLVLDEPGAFLDPYHQDLLLRLLLRLNRERGISILVVTHDVNLALHAAHRTLALRGGRVVFDGPSGELAGENVLSDIYGLPFAFLPTGRGRQLLAVSGAHAVW